MISLVEGASRKKTPNEIALNILLISLTVIFLIVVVTLYCFSDYSGVEIPVATLIALLVCLIPTTIGGLLSAIGIAGMDRVTRYNVIANILLISLTVIFLIVVVTLYCFADYSGVEIPVATLIALLVCLIPTTIGGLLSAIGIAGMDRVTRYNVIALSGKAVEACGDVDTMILDKTGTITYGNRLAADFIPVEGVKKEDLIDYAVMTSLSDATPEGKSVVELGKTMGTRMEESAADQVEFVTPEGKSVVELGKTMGTRMEESAADQVEFVEFTAQSKMSGVNLEDGTQIRKGAFDAIKKYVAAKGGKIPSDLEKIVTDISSLGGTPLVVCVENVIYGVIYLKDTVKPGLVERFELLREIGIKTIMCTGDNPLTAATIAKDLWNDLNG